MPELIKIESLINDTPQELLQIGRGGITFGRDVDNGVVIDSNAVSRRHGCLIEAGSQWVYSDLGSTNGSWVNGIQSEGGSTKLIRIGDVLQLANFPMRISRVDSFGVQPHDPDPSVIVFLGTTFQAEGFLTDMEPVYIVGGPESNIPTDSELQLEQIKIERKTHYVQLTISDAASNVMVNGVLSRGVMTLGDRDVVHVCGYTLILSDMSSATPEVDWHSRVDAQTRETAAGIGAYGPDSRPMEYVRHEANDGGWANESERRRVNSGHKFVFGSNIEHGDEDLDVEGTVMFNPDRTSGMPTGGLRFRNARYVQKTNGMNTALLVAFLVLLAIAMFSGAMVLLLF